MPHFPLCHWLKQVTQPRPEPHSPSLWPSAAQGHNLEKTPSSRPSDRGLTQCRRSRETPWLSPAPKRPSLHTPNTTARGPGFQASRSWELATSCTPALCPQPKLPASPKKGLPSILFSSSPVDIIQSPREKERRCGEDKAVWGGLLGKGARGWRTDRSEEGGPW